MNKNTKVILNNIEEELERLEARMYDNSNENKAIWLKLGILRGKLYSLLHPRKYKG